MEAAGTLLLKTSSSYAAPETGGYGAGKSGRVEMYENPDSFNAIYRETSARQAMQEADADERVKAARTAENAGQARSAAESTEEARAAGRSLSSESRDLSQETESGRAADDAERRSGEAEGNGKAGAGENSPGAASGGEGRKADFGEKEKKNGAGRDGKVDPKIINIKSGKRDEAGQAEKTGPDAPKLKGKKAETAAAEVQAAAADLEAALAGDTNAGAGSAAENSAGTEGGGSIGGGSRTAETAAEQTGNTGGSGGKTASAVIEMNTEKKEKQFFFIDKRSAPERGGESAAGKGELKASARAAAEKNRNGGKTDGGQGRNPEMKNENGAAVQAVKEEMFDSGEKFFKVPADLQNRQAVQQQNDSFGQKHTQSAALQRHLAEQGNRQIVKQSGIILKDNNSGEIRLVLKPENMGSVRIQLQMQDNSITGKIVVDNSTVKTAFDQNMDDLYRAFKESGFDNAELDVQVGGGKSGQKRQKDDGHTGPAFHHVRIMEEQIPLSGGRKSADTLIDLVV